ncbi:hypothetical protein DL96DRAFT_1708097 [Flagelloscypha sp. PMI_526]|nr:hypothetical protein DL96DRAFT_1708097 [Flagelloscypha sp. PMI_526]
MGASHRLPLDILRLLLEFSASANIESARALSLVSKEVQQWTDPHLFQTVKGLGLRYSGDRMPDATLLERVCMSDASPRLIRARKHVHTVAWERNVPHKSSIEPVLKYFPHLVQLCLWSNIFPYRQSQFGSQREHFEITRSYPSLRRLATCIYSLLNISPNAFGSPFWMTITHLHVRYFIAISSQGSPLQLPLFATMKSLTHLALSPVSGEGEDDSNLAFSRVGGAFPLSLNVCLLGMRAPINVDREQWFSELVAIGLQVDERIVLWSVFPVDYTDGQLVPNRNDSDNFQAWCGVPDGVQTFWEMAEAIVKKRQERFQTV